MQAHMILQTNPYTVKNSNVIVWYYTLVFLIVLVRRFPKKKEKI
jgi:hypothetical protein